MQLIYIYLQQDPLLVARFVGYYSYAYSFMLDSFTERPFISFTEGTFTSFTERPFALLTEGPFASLTEGSLSLSAPPVRSLRALARSLNVVVSQRSGLR